MIKIAMIPFLTMLLLSSCDKNTNNVSQVIPVETTYRMPIESDPHEGTWLQWPQPYQYGKKYAEQLYPTWIAMTRELVQVGKVHVIAYDEKHKALIIDQLQKNNINLENVLFYLFKTNGVWVRDNGPIFVFDQLGNLVVEGWGFNGWGDKFEYDYDKQIPQKVAGALNLPYVDLQNKLIVEGGAYEFSVKGSIILTESSILNDDRNPGKTREDVEKDLKTYLGVTDFIWLKGARVGITDMHVDGFARFTPDGNTIITMSKKDLSYWELTQKDINYLYSVKTSDGKDYKYVQLPLTQNNVVTTYGKNTGIQASYINYYITNGLVLVPVYDDPNDDVALGLIRQIYPDRKVVGIPAQNVYAEGGMIHCITQQQPAK